jgi:hypothetical protein
MFYNIRYYVVFFLLGNSPASEFYVPTFQYPMKMGQSVPKSRHLKFRGWGMAQKKECNIHKRQKFEIKNPYTNWMNYTITQFRTRLYLYS